MKCAKISTEVVQNVKNQWNNAIAIYVFGPEPYYPYFRGYISRVWKPTKEFSIFSKENSFNVIKFNNKQDCERVLEGGPYYYNKKLMMMKKWMLGMKVSKELLYSIPIWVCFPNLPLDCWTKEEISRIASVLGTPIKLDKIIEGIITIVYARVLIKIKNNFEFLSKIPILSKAHDIVWQGVTYEWKPDTCSNCLSFGHFES